MNKITPKSVFDVEPDEEHEARLDAKAEADIVAGRVVPHAKVADWLDTWGTPDVSPPPQSKPRG